MITDGGRQPDERSSGKVEEHQFQAETKKLLD
jgi:hypothetical protein